MSPHTMKRKGITVREAVARLRRRWQEQIRLYPTMERDIPLSLYLHANLLHVATHGLLGGYKRKGD